jgi:hypothetical protein
MNTRRSRIGTFDGMCALYSTTGRSTPRTVGCQDERCIKPATPVQTCGESSHIQSVHDVRTGTGEASTSGSRRSTFSTTFHGRAKPGDNVEQRLENFDLLASWALALGNNLRRFRASGYDKQTPVNDPIIRRIHELHGGAFPATLSAHIEPLD